MKNGAGSSLKKRIVREEKSSRLRERQRFCAYILYGEMTAGDETMQ